MTRFTRIVAATLLVVGGTALAGCGTSAPTTQAPAPTPAPVASAPKKANLYLTILSGGQNGKKEWPNFLPSNFTIPADTDVTVTIADFDDGAAPIPADSAKVQGTVDGSMTVISALNGDLSKAPSKNVTELPADIVAHTFTINDNGFNLNVPIPAEATVTFTFHSPKAGTYSYRCLSGCGTGSTGTEGAMATDGWMRGTVTVQ